MYTHREYVRPRKAQRTTAKHSRYCARTGSSSSSREGPQDCQSAQIRATAPGSESASSSGAGSNSVFADLAHRQVDLVRVLWSDLHGVARGKDITVEELPSAVERGVGFCQAVLLTDLSATPLSGAETSGRGWPDAVAHPDLGTL